MIRIESAPSVSQTYFDTRLRRRVHRPVQQFVRHKVDGRTFKRSAPAKKRSMWGALTELFKGTA